MIKDLWRATVRPTVAERCLDLSLGGLQAALVGMHVLPLVNGPLPSTSTPLSTPIQAALLPSKGPPRVNVHTAGGGCVLPCL